MFSSIQAKLTTNYEHVIQEKMLPSFSYYLWSVLNYFVTLLKYYTDYTQFSEHIYYLRCAG